MKAKLPLLIAAGLFFATISKAQYVGVDVDAQVVTPGRAVVAYNYDNRDHDRYADRREWRDGEYVGFARSHRDWREDEYERYCRDHREFRGDRDDYYRYHYRVAPYCAPRRVVVYGY
jgi:hypothetical protein